MSDQAFLGLIAGAVRGDAPRWPGPSDAEAATDFLETARRHGMHLLVAEGLRQGGAPEGWPLPVASGLAADRRAAILIEALQRQAIATALEAIHAAGCPALVFKGVPLAHTCYPTPWLRPSVDTDVLVRPADRDLATRALEAAGYRRTLLVDGSLVMRQAGFEKTLRGGVRHVIDLHWRLANPEPFASALTFDDLHARAIPVPAIGARAPDPVHHLLVACAHRVAHHAAAPRLLWRYDVHLLVGSMEARALEAFAGLARDRAMGGIVAHEITAAHALFGTRSDLPLDDLLARLRPAASEPSAGFLSRRDRRAVRLAAEIRWQPGWRNKARLVGQHLLPSPAYMRAAYHGSRIAWLPAQYVHRILRGAGRWLRREHA